MTTRELIQWLGQHPLPLASIFLLLPLLSWLCGRLHGPDRGGEAPWKFLYAILVYLVCIPGMFAAVLTGYALFFTRENLLDANLLVYLLPLASMVVTLVLIRKSVSFDLVPGFDRLSGLMVMIGCSFGVALAIQKTNIWILFGGPIAQLFVIATAVFALLKWGTYSLFRKKDEPRMDPPGMPKL